MKPLPNLKPSRDVACLGAFITIVSVFFNAITQNVLGTYVSMQNGESLDLVAGRVPRSEYFNLTDQPPDSELTLRMLCTTVTVQPNVICSHNQRTNLALTCQPSRPFTTASSPTRLTTCLSLAQQETAHGRSSLPLEYVVHVWT